LNYLAHFYLVKDFPEFYSGVFIADQVKGKRIQNYNIVVKKGIAHHRWVDEFCDAHSSFKANKQLVAESQQKYAGVAVDILHDFVLTKKLAQKKFSIESFASAIYRNLESEKLLFPEFSQKALYYMQKDNWLFNYQFQEGIERALLGLSRRAKFESNLMMAFEAYLKVENDFDINFQDLWQSIEKENVTKLNEIINS
jgi:acyl carrier protein phosphodiesterase